MSKVYNITTSIFLLLLFAVMPFVVVKDLFDPTQTGKFIFLVSGSIAITVCYASNLLVAPNKSYTITAIDLVVFVLLTYILINYFYLHSELIFSIKVYSLISLAALYLVFRTISAKIIYYLLIVLSITAFVQAVYGTLQLFEILPSNHVSFLITGTFFNPGPFSGFLACLFPISLGLYFFDKAPYHFSDNQFLNRAVVVVLKWIPFISMLSILMVLPVAESRAAWISAFISSGFLMWKKGIFKQIQQKSQNYRFLKWLYLLTFVLVAFIAVAGIYSFKKDSADGRKLIWTVAIDAIKDHKWVGVGFDRFNVNYMEYQSNFFINDKTNKYGQLADVVTDAFNEPIQLLMEIGIIGGIICCALLIMMTYVVIKSDNWVVAIAGASLLSMLIFAMFSYPSKILPIMIIAFFLIAIVSANSPEVHKHKIFLKGVMTPIELLFIRTIMALILIGCFKSVYYIKNVYSAYWYWQEADELYNLKDYTVANKSYQKALPFLYNNGIFLQHYGKSLYLEGEINNAIPVLTQSLQYFKSDISYQALGDCQKKLKNFIQAEQYYLKAESLVPGKFYPDYLLTKLYYETGQEQKAAGMAKLLLNRKVKIPSKAIDDIKLEMKHILFMYNQFEYK